jgi:hypothetical protein
MVKRKSVALLFCHTSYTPTFLKPSHSSHLPAYEDGTECSETSAYKIQTQGNYPEESRQHSEHGESLKSGRILPSCHLLRTLHFAFRLWLSQATANICLNNASPLLLVMEMQLSPWNGDSRSLRNLATHTMLYGVTDQKTSVFIIIPFHVTWIFWVK